DKDLETSRWHEFHQTPGSRFTTYMLIVNPIINLVYTSSYASEHMDIDSMDYFVDRTYITGNFFSTLRM
ncbi:hypothetical protein, partial [Sphaerochaeta sp. S2]|uniref:hypothetical protein n=1 Tax=Sphaerochaeta sp. S2 TaxID=2798868 RepID=UPI001E5B2397